MSEDKHLKGYMYDSLVYRYQFARYKYMEQETQDLMMSRGLDKDRAREVAWTRYERDCSRFIQILNEAIGEHD